ncbi:uncharacterized protein LOC135338048 [Halichondria panicea]|uniref:uncharacterized protein LOC135338048 n=1 Tax=Halichondria panicea TaxID=6063 RepID=UPI00312B35ED
MNSLLLLVVALCAGPVWSQVTQAPVAGQCELQGYDLHRLTSVDQWTFDLPKTAQWLIPTNISASDVASVSVSMSLCKPLPSGNCKSNENATVCQHIILKNGTSVDIDLASFDKSEKLNYLDSSAGFSLQQKSQIPVNYTQCASGKLNTILGFECNATSKWSDKNISNFVFADDRLSPCFIEIAFKYNGSCYNAPTVAPANCQLDGYNTSTLSKQPFWFATVPHTVCFNGTEDRLCTIFFSFCHAIPETTLFNLDSCHKENAAVCQIGESKDGVKESEYSMGQYKETTRFIPNDEAVNGGFHLEALNGSNPKNDSHCNSNFNTIIILGCNKDVQWPESGDLTNHIVPYYNEQCQWVFELQYDGACLSEFPVVNQDVPSPVGWILMGLCGLAVIIYLAVGMSVQYFVKGARGSDIIPHVTFWTGVGTLVVEGCKFSLDVVTCFHFKDGFKPIRGPNSGVQYDQI